MGLFGGDSSSSSSSTSIDKRMVVDGQGVGINSDSSTVNLLDAGAFKNAVDFASAGADVNARNFGQMLDFAGAGADVNARNFGQMLDFAGGVYDSAFGVLDTAQKGVASSGDLVAKAYDNAQGMGDQKTGLYIMAGAVIALVALWKIKL